jgi:hypothetical protein
VDIAVSDFNASTLSSVTLPVVHVSGNCESVSLSGLDVGVTVPAADPPPAPQPPVPSANVLWISASGASGPSPAEIDISGSVFQGGGYGVVVSDASSRIRFRGVMAKKNRNDGWRFDGSGSAILVDGCQAQTNNQANTNDNPNTAYDVNVTSTAHVGLFGFAYCSTTVTNSLNLVSGNHVTNANSTSPGGKSTTGAMQGMW